MCLNLISHQNLLLQIHVWLPFAENKVSQNIGTSFLLFSTVWLLFVLVIKHLKCHQKFRSDLLASHGASIQSCNAQRKWLEYHHLPDHTSLVNVSKDNKNSYLYSKLHVTHTWGQFNKTLTCVIYNCSYCS